MPSHCSDIKLYESLALLARSIGLRCVLPGIRYASLAGWSEVCCAGCLGMPNSLHGALDCSSRVVQLSVGAVVMYV